MSSLTGCPRLVSSPASASSDSAVHRSGDSGSPRVTGSTKASSAAGSPGSTCSARLRPAPGRRTRAAGATPPDNSLIPSEIVSRATPVTDATSATPPYPSDRASAASHSLRARSSNDSRRSSHRRVSADSSRSRSSAAIVRSFTTQVDH